MHSQTEVQSAALERQVPLPGHAATVDVTSIRDSSQQLAVAKLWAAAWSRLEAAEHPNVEERLAELEHARPTRARSLDRLASSAGRAAGRAIRGEATLADVEGRLRAWSDGVLAALAELDHGRSVRLCADCAADDVATILPSLTGGRICQRCAREVTP